MVILEYNGAMLFISFPVCLFPLCTYLHLKPEQCVIVTDGVRKEHWFFPPFYNNHFTNWSSRHFVPFINLHYSSAH